MLARPYERTARRIARVLAKDLFFVDGAPKSGTTWLELLLDRHPQVVCKGEAHFFDFLRVYLGEALNSYNGRLRVHGGHTNVIRSENQGLRHLVVTAIGLLYARWGDHPAVTRIGEKTPANVGLLAIVEQYLPGAKTVHFVRDGRDGAVSGWHFNLNRNEAETRTRFHDLSDYLDFYAKTLAVQIGAARRHGARVGPGRFAEVRYEDLLAAPQQETARLLDFLGVESAPATVAACLEATSFEALSGGRKRGEERRDSFYRKAVAGDWRNHLSAADVARFQAHAGDLLEALGYAPGRAGDSDEEPG